MENPMPAAPAASSSQQQQPRLQAATQLQQNRQKDIPNELEGLLRGMQEAQSPSHCNKHMNWVRRFNQEET